MCLACCVTVHTHMLMEEQYSSNQTTISLQVNNRTDAPPVLIVAVRRRARCVAISAPSATAASSRPSATAAWDTRNAEHSLTGAIMIRMIM
ncbi:hypothetical protein PO909_005313 [Leuciscus waleckii]